MIPSKNKRILENVTCKKIGTMEKLLKIIKNRKQIISNVFVIIC